MGYARLRARGERGQGGGSGQGAGSLRGAYAATSQSGVAIAGASGTIGGAAVEGSNTDIADEFTKLIVTQQAYSANTKVITTAQTMVQDLLNVLR